MLVVIRFAEWKGSFSSKAIEGVVCWLEEAMTYAHMVKGEQEDDVCLTTIINKYFVQIPPCHSKIYHKHIWMGRTAEIDIPCIEGKRHVGTLRLKDGPGEGCMVYPLVVLFLLSFYFEHGTRPFGNHVDSPSEGLIGEVFLLW
jgi:hypothetical protein